MLRASVGRREILRMLAAATAAAAASAALAGCADDEALAPLAAPPLFSADELAAIDALAYVELPPDDQPGGAALGAQAYIVRLLTAFDDVPAGLAPPYHAGGPYSGRQPYPDAHGDPSTTFPPNEFATFLALDRVSDRAARLLIYGSAGVDGGGPNDAVIGPTVGLRDLVKKGLAQAMSATTGALSDLDYDSLVTALEGTDDDFQEAFVELVCEAAFAAPEYGGNPGGAGWAMVHFEGDAQPLGYSLFDPSTASYHERADAPVSTPNPYPDPEPMTEDISSFVGGIAVLSGGQAFS
jgi:hypothetical protein